MRKGTEKRYLAVLLIIFALFASTVFSVAASPKVRSKSITLNVGSATIGIGDIVTLDAVMNPANSTDTIKWTSSNKKIATVNKYGVVTALKEGKATITAKTSSKKKAKCVVTVKNHLSKAEISALISKQCLSEETVKKLIKENALSETDVKKIVDESIGESMGHTLSEETVKKLIKENALSETDVKKIVDESIGEGMGGTDWADGTELKLLSSQSLPVSGTYEKDKSIQVTVEKITVRKYRYDGEWDGQARKYKYTVEIQGSLTDNFDSTKYGASVCIGFMNNYSMSSGVYSVPLEDKSDGNKDSSYQENGGKFVVTAELYSLYADYDEYMFYGDNMGIDIYEKENDSGYDDI